jgi:cytochrome P450
MLGAADRDPAAFPNPDEPELDRPGPDSLVFAPGPYRCIGAQLATFEVEVALRKLLERPAFSFPRIRRYGPTARTLRRSRLLQASFVSS